MHHKGFLSIILISFIICFGCSSPDKKYTSWAVYNGTKEGLKYSSLTQIDTNNVDQLSVAWTYHTGDADTAHHSQIQCNPIVVDGILYGVTPQMKLFAIDAGNGEEKWVFDPNNPTDYDNNRNAYHNMINSRGVAYWSDGKDDKRIFFTAGSNTFAVCGSAGLRSTVSSPSNTKPTPSSSLRAAAGSIRWSAFGTAKPGSVFAT